MSAARPISVMGSALPSVERAVADDKELDETSRRLLDSVEQLRFLERRKRSAPRSTDEFHSLAAQVEEKAKEVWDNAREEQDMGEEDSPDPKERDRQEPGDWTR